MDLLILHKATRFYAKTNQASSYNAAYNNKSSDIPKVILTLAVSCTNEKNKVNSRENTFNNGRFYY